MGIDEDRIRLEDMRKSLEYKCDDLNDLEFEIDTLEDDIRDLENEIKEFDSKQDSLNLNNTSLEAKE